VSFVGPTGTWTGQQAISYRTWTVVGFLLNHNLLRGPQQDGALLDIDPSHLKQIQKSRDGDRGLTVIRQE
jgi:Plant neutral invertase.